MDFVGELYRSGLVRSVCSNFFGRQSQLYGFALRFVENKWAVFRDAIASFNRTQLITSGGHLFETVSSMRAGSKCKFMRMVVSLERYRRVLNRVLFGIVDNSCNDC